MKRLVIFLGILICAATSTAQAYKVGEKITIEVEYWARLWPNTTVGKIVFDVAQDGPDYRITSTATLSGLFGWMYKLNDTYTTWINPATGLSIHAAANLSEGSWRFASRYNFNRSNRTVEVDNRRGNATEFTQSRIEAPDLIMDGVALFYWLRNQDVSFLAIGQTKILPVMLEDTVRHIQIKFWGAERRKIKGTVITALKYSCQVFKRGSMRDLMGDPFYLWLSDDERHLPLFLESPIRIGHIRATLISVEN